MGRRLSGRVVIATHNNGKLAEMRHLLAPHGVEAVSAGELGLPEPEETGTTFIANAKIKALSAALASKLPAISDDSGLCVAALDGAPGIYSARWAGADKDFGHAMEKVEAALRERDAFGLLPEVLKQAAVARNEYLQVEAFLLLAAVLKVRRRGVQLEGRQTHLQH